MGGQFFIPDQLDLWHIPCEQVAAIVFTEDLKKLYVTMREGFPLEYIVDIPLDPHLFEMISSSGVEVDLLQRRQIHYIFKVVIALVPGILILWCIRESVMLLHVTSKRFLYKKYNQLFDMAYAENFILGVLLSGPPGTGKTLFARTLAKESGMPFVFASGAEFTDSEKSGAARINEMFSIARRNAPCFVFVDEIDAIAGRHARKDPRRKATFEALIAQLEESK
ncbi:ATP-dependent zinc metalloprotease FTSH 12, chloroplastic [Vitis vinifera]|uniref:ATP-dependent zinc metalloprotease FTSH 12, chloroplastic n=1 Tax=Vitis vinifera TaxID=29760 RepID=A0A438CQZ3_VITVI|nr:ATP-dependent zinc metalloprotease FTSH 12, chloroplastic [Vitis vinifera]